MPAGDDEDEETRHDPASAVSEHASRPFALTGPVEAGDTAALPVRGDLAHIALAGRFFVPHYAVPQPRIVMPGGAALHPAPDARSPILCEIIEGESFELLELAGEWAWGCLSLEGPTGYVHADRLEALS